MTTRDIITTLVGLIFALIAYSFTTSLASVNEKNRDQDKTVEEIRKWQLDQTSNISLLLERTKWLENPRLQKLLTQ